MFLVTFKIGQTTFIIVVFISSTEHLIKARNKEIFLLLVNEKIQNAFSLIDIHLTFHFQIPKKGMLTSFMVEFVKLKYKLFKRQ